MIFHIEHSAFVIKSEIFGHIQQSSEIGNVQSLDNIQRIFEHLGKTLENCLKLLIGYVVAYIINKKKNRGRLRDNKFLFSNQLDFHLFVIKMNSRGEI